MKKLISLMLAVLMMLGMLVSCAEETPKGSSFRPFAVGGVTVTLDAEADTVIASLGEPKAFAETGSCYGDGKDKVYQYVSYKIMTYSKAGKDYILSVEIYDDADDTVATPEGVRVGDSAETVTARHGTPDSQNDLQIVYLDAEGGTKLQFLLRDGKVTNIQYLKIK